MKTILKLSMLLVALTTGGICFAQVRSCHYEVHTHSYFRPQPRFEDSFDLRLGIGSGPVMAASKFIHGNSYWGHDYMNIGNASLDEFYSDYHGPTSTTGAISLGADFFIKRWFSVSVDLAATFIWHDMYDAVTDVKVGNETGAALYILPRAKFIYMNRPNVRLYGSIGVGLVKYIGFDKLRYTYRTEYDLVFVDDTLCPTFQMSPIGIEVGRKLFGFAELGYGSMFNGIQAGIGYRF